MFLGYLYFYSGEDVIDDQNDPAFEGRDSDREESAGFAGFVLNPYMTDGFFCPAETIEKSKRIRFLQLRAQEVSEFVGRTMVPLREHEILDSEFQKYESRLERTYQDTSPGRFVCHFRNQLKLAEFCIFVPYYFVFNIISWSDQNQTTVARLFVRNDNELRKWSSNGCEQFRRRLVLTKSVSFDILLQNKLCLYLWINVVN